MAQKPERIANDFQEQVASDFTPEPFNLQGGVSRDVQGMREAHTRALEEGARADEQVAKYDDYGNYLGMGLRLAGGFGGIPGMALAEPLAQFAERAGTGKPIFNPTETAVSTLSMGLPQIGQGVRTGARQLFPEIAEQAGKVSGVVGRAAERFIPGASPSIPSTLPGLAARAGYRAGQGAVGGAGVGAGLNVASNVLEGRNPFENTGEAATTGAVMGGGIAPLHEIGRQFNQGFGARRSAYKDTKALKKVKSVISGYSEKYSPAGTFKPEGAEDQVRAVLDQMNREQRLNPTIKGISDYAALARRSSDNLYQTQIAPIESRMTGAEVSPTERQMMLIKVRKAILSDPVASSSSKAQQVAQAEGIINGLRNGGDIFSTRKSLNQHLKDFQSGSLSEQMTDLASLPTAAKKALLDELRNTAATMGDKFGGSPDYRRLLQDEARGINFRDAAENVHDASQVYDRAIASGMKPKEATEFMQKHLLNLALSGHAGIMPGTAAVAAIRNAGNVNKPFKNLKLSRAEKALKPSPEYATPLPIGIPEQTGGPYPLPPDPSFVKGTPNFPQTPPPIGGETSPPFPSPQVSATDPGWTSTMIPHAPLPSGITPEFLTAQQKGTLQRTLPLPSQENIGVYSNPAGGTTFEVPESLMTAYGAHRGELGDTSYGGGSLQGLHSNVSGMMPYLERMESAGNIPRGLSSTSPRNAGLLNLKVGGTLLRGEASKLPPESSLNLSVPSSVGHETTHAYQQEVSPGGLAASSVGLRGISPTGKNTPSIENRLLELRTRLGKLWGGLSPDDPRVVAGLHKELEAYTIGGKPGILGITPDEATSLMNGMVDRTANEEQLKTLFKIGGQNFRDYVYRGYSDPTLNEMKPSIPPPPTEQDILDLNHLY
jgi:hypothetical protein